jgi:hypothetical protein
MCGDYRCRSCGPAQGNNYCYICGKFDDEGGCKTPKKCNTELNKMERQYKKDALIDEIIEESGGYEETTIEFRNSLRNKTIKQLEKMRNKVPELK